MQLHSSSFMQTLSRSLKNFESGKYFASGVVGANLVTLMLGPVIKVKNFELEDPCTIHEFSKGFIFKTKGEIFESKRLHTCLTNQLNHQVMFSSVSQSVSDTAGLTWDRYRQSVFEFGLIGSNIA